MFHHGLRNGTLTKFLNQDMKELTPEELAEIKNYMIENAGEKIMFWNRNLRMLVSKLESAISVEEVRELNRKLREAGVDLF